MVKKYLSTTLVVVLMAAGIGIINSPVTHAVDVTQFTINVTNAPSYNMPTGAISMSNANSLNPEWSISSITWSPTVASNFDSNTVYVATLTLNAIGTNFNNVPTNGFTLAGAGAPGATDSSTAVAAGANATSLIVQITFPITVVVQMSATTVVSNITDTSADVDFSTLAAAHPGVSTWHARLFRIVGQTSTFLNSRDASGSSPSVTLTGLTANTTYSIFFGDPNHANGVDYGYEPGKRFTTLTGSGSLSTPTVDSVAIAEAAAKAAAAVATAKNAVVDSLKSGKTLTVSELSAADIRVASEQALARVNTRLLALPVEKRTDLAAVAAIVRTENFVDKASSGATRTRITPKELVIENLVPADYLYKYTVLRTILAKDPASTDTLEEIRLAVDEAMAKIQARKDRAAAVKARIQARN